MDQISKFQKQLYQNFGIPVSKFQNSWIKYQNFKSVDQNFRGLDHGSKFKKQMDHWSEFTPSRALIIVCTGNWIILRCACISDLVRIISLTFYHMPYTCTIMCISSLLFSMQIQFIARHIWMCTSFYALAFSLYLKSDACLELFILTRPTDLHIYDDLLKTWRSRHLSNIMYKTWIITHRKSTTNVSVLIQFYFLLKWCFVSIYIIIYISYIYSWFYMYMYRYIQRYIQNCT